MTAAMISFFTVEDGRMQIPDQPGTRRPLSEAVADVLAFCSRNDSWIVEGCRSELRIAALGAAQVPVEGTAGPEPFHAARLGLGLLFATRGDVIRGAPGALSVLCRTEAAAYGKFMGDA